MSDGRVSELGQGRLLLDLGFRDHDGLIASYLVPGPEGWTLVETGPGSCRQALEAGVREAGIEPGEVARILVTHIHLDHSGGLGLAASAFPNARLYAHSEGVAHLVDPARLLASAARAWGPAAAELFGPTAPVPADRLTALRGGERFPVVGGEIVALATPGHARHHLSFLDEPSGGLFVGDSAGIRVGGSSRARPAVPPPDLDVERLLESLETMRARSPRTLRYAHFGEFPGADEALPAYGREVLRWKEAALRAAREAPTIGGVAAALRAEALGPEAGPSASETSEMVSAFEMAAAGFLRYFRRTGLVPE